MTVKDLIDAGYVHKDELEDTCQDSYRKSFEHYRINVYLMRFRLYQYKPVVSERLDVRVAMNRPPFAVFAIECYDLEQMTVEEMESFFRQAYEGLGCEPFPQNGEPCR
jgi:hypothetical protein